MYVLLNKHLNIIIPVLYCVWEGLVSNFSLGTRCSKAYFVFLLYLSHRILDEYVDIYCNILYRIQFTVTWSFNILCK